MVGYIWTQFRNLYRQHLSEAPTGVIISEAVILNGEEVERDAMILLNDINGNLDE